MNRALSIPNLPGYVADKESWQMRASDGFRRGKDGCRPKSSTGLRRSATTLSTAIAAATANAASGGSVLGAASVGGLLESSLLFEEGSFLHVNGTPQEQQQQQQQQQKQQRTQQPGKLRSLNALNGATSPVLVRSRGTRPKSANTSNMYTRMPNASPFDTSRVAVMNTNSTSDELAHAQYQHQQQKAPEVTTAAVTTAAAASAATAKIATTANKIEMIDKRVCRFAAHFFEERMWDKEAPIGVPQIEQTMIRGLQICMHMCDSSIEIFEVEQKNAGVSGGRFFKRARVMKDNDHKPLVINDLVPGRAVYILGQEMHITDADQFTRRLFQDEYGITLPPKIARPEMARQDLGVHYALGMGMKPVPPRETNIFPPTYDFYQRKEALQRTHRFLFSGSRPLRFECLELIDSLDDSNGHLPVIKWHEFLQKRSMSNNSNSSNSNPIESSTSRAKKQVANVLRIPADTRKFSFSYYMADSQVEMNLLVKTGEVQAHQENLLVLKKSKWPKNWFDVTKGKAEIYFQPSDFYCGGMIDLYGRKYALVDCDDYTASVYVNKFNFVQQIVPLEVFYPPKVVHPIPVLGDGFLAIGRPEETLETVYGQPKAAHTLRREQKNIGRQIRCKTKLISEKSNDALRLFNVCFYLEDSSIQIYEEVIGNTGFPGGNFLKRGRHLNSLPEGGTEPRYFVPTDFVLGNVFAVNLFEMRIVEMDALSLQFCETHPDEFPLSDIFRIVYDLLTRSVDQALDCREFFKYYDKSGHGSLRTKLFLSLLDECQLGSHLHDQELLTILRRFQDDLGSGAGKNTQTGAATSGEEDEAGGEEENSATGAVWGVGGTVRYDELCDLLSHTYVAQNNIGKPKSVIDKVPNLPSLLGIARARTTQWRRIFRKDMHADHGLIAIEYLSSIFQKYGVVLSNNCKKEIAARYAVSDITDVRVRHLTQAVRDRIASDPHYHHRHQDTKAQSKTITGPTSNTINRKIGERGFREEGEEDEEEEEAEVDNQAKAARAIEERRRALLRPILRSSDNKSKPSSPTASPRKKTTGAGMSMSMLLPEQVIIDFASLCNDVYPQDWSRGL